MIPASLPLFQTASAAWHSSDASMRTFPLQIKKKWEKRGSWSIDIVFWIRYINIWSETAGGGGVLCSQICSFYTNLRVLTMPMFTTSWTVSPECCKRGGPRNTGMTNRAIRSHRGGSNSLTSLSTDCPFNYVKKIGELEYTAFIASEMYILTKTFKDNDPTSRASIFE